MQVLGQCHGVLLLLLSFSLESFKLFINCLFPSQYVLKLELYLLELNCILGNDMLSYVMSYLEMIDDILLLCHLIRGLSFFLVAIVAALFLAGTPI